MNESLSSVGNDTSPQDHLWPPSRGFSQNQTSGAFPGEADEPAPFDLRCTIDTVAADLARRRGAKDLTLEVRYPLGAPKFLIGYGDRIRQVMTKLIARAIQLATVRGDRGRVTVNVQGDECSDGCAAMRLRVEVAGAGGRDLGAVSAIADCRRLVELMGGRLGVLTESGKGFVWLAMKLPVDASRSRAWEPR